MECVYGATITNKWYKMEKNYHPFAREVARHLQKHAFFFLKNKRLMAATGTQNDAPFSFVPVAGLADA